jgi:hypothetical protein
MRLLPWGLFLVVGCGGGGSGVTLRFSNQASPLGQGLGHSRQGLGGPRAPTIYGAKLLAVYVAADVDPVTQNNVGATEMIYLNPACAGDISHCELGPGTNPMDGLPYTHFVTTYFDFAADSAAVNAAINAQQLTVAAGTYRYARMEFCKGNEGGLPTLEWADGTAAPSEVVYNQCGVTSAAFDPPLVVGAGSSLAVTLSYDLSASVTDAVPGQSGGSMCTATACFAPPRFVPSASVL